MTINIARKFVSLELLLFLLIFVIGSMLSEALPYVYKICLKASSELNHSLSKKTNRINILCTHNDTTAISEEQTNCVIPKDSTEINHSENKPSTTNKNKELSEEIINYVTKTFENILTQENIEKLLNNFRKLNTGDHYEVIEKKKLDNVLEFDLAHFAWNVCKRIYDKNTCLVKFTEATAEIIKASFPLTLLNYDVDTLKQRLRDSAPTTKFRLPIIELGEELVPFDWNKKTLTDKI